MRRLVILAVLVVIGLGLAGCGKPDAHDQYISRQMRQSLAVDKRALAWDVHNVFLMDTRPSHLSYFVDE